eukprot:s2867_g14.t2
MIDQWNSAYLKRTPQRLDAPTSFVLTELRIDHDAKKGVGPPGCRIPFLVAVCSGHSQSRTSFALIRGDRCGAVAERKKKSSDNNYVKVLQQELADQSERHGKELKRLNDEVKLLHERLKAVLDRRSKQAVQPPSIDSTFVRRVEWRLPNCKQDVRTVERGQSMWSGPFSASGITEMQLEFFPQGRENSQSGFCALFLWAPGNVRLKYRLQVGNHSTWDEDFFDRWMGHGHSNFCNLEGVPLSVAPGPAGHVGLAALAAPQIQRCTPSVQMAPRTGPATLICYLFWQIKSLAVIDPVGASPVSVATLATLAAATAVADRWVRSARRFRSGPSRRRAKDHNFSGKTIETMMKFSNQYAKVTKTKYCEDKSVPAVVIVGLALHKETLGAPLCPCRHYENKELEVKNGYWNCPCVPMRERHECHCMLFLKDDNPFASECSTIDLEEIMKLKDGADISLQAQIEKDSLVIRVEILEVTVTEDLGDGLRLINQGISQPLKLEAAVIRNRDLDTVEWTVRNIRQRMRDVPRGQYVCSPSFSIAAVRNMHIEFYPNGLEGSKNGYCGLYVRSPGGKYTLNLTLSVGSATRGPSRTELDGNSAKGLPEFCKINEQLDEKEDLVIGIKVQNPLDRDVEERSLAL